MANLLRQEPNSPKCILAGVREIQTLLARRKGHFVLGDDLSLADVAVAPFVGRLLATGRAGRSSRPRVTRDQVLIGLGLLGSQCAQVCLLVTSLHASRPIPSSRRSRHTRCASSRGRPGRLVHRSSSGAVRVLAGALLIADSYRDYNRQRLTSLTCSSRLGSA